jgi:hypothetical protein
MAAPMLQMVARTVGGRALFRTWCEARVLWDFVVRSTPGLVALVLMPNHLHLVHPTDVRRRLAAGLGAYVRWRHARWGGSGQVLERMPDPRPLDDAQKLRRYIKYTHLNPSRAYLIKDPLLWPFSTHRDACGLAEPSAIPRAPDVVRFHRQVSSDPFVTPEGRGTEFPITKVEVDDPLLVLHAVSAVTRTCLDEMEHRGGPRTLYLRAARELCPGASFRQIGSLVNAGERTAQRAAKKQDSRIQMVARAVSDPRFPPLTDVPLRWENPYYRK